jgi:hypothetical protein
VILVRWRGLTRSRSIAVWSVATVLALIVLVAARAMRHDAAPAANLAETRRSDVESAAKTPDDAPSPNVPQNAASAFLSEVKAAAPGTWSILESPALEARDIGTWDDFRVGSPVVMKDAGRTGFRMWYLGCRFGERQYDCGVGHATSADGVGWVRGESPVFVPPNLPSPFWLNTLAIVRRSDAYWMWYSVDGDPFGEPRATVRMATSADGIAWQDSGVVLTGATNTRRRIRHTVVDTGQLFHLWYFDATDGRAGEELLHLTSPDGTTWTNAGSDALDGRASEVGRPWITPDGSGGFRAVFLDERQNVFRWFTSNDGTAWNAGETELDPHAGGRAGSIVDAVGLQQPDGLWLWMTQCRDSRAAESIGAAFRKGSRR